MPVNVCLLGSRPFVFLSVLYIDLLGSCVTLILQPGKVGIGKTCMAKVTALKKKEKRTSQKQVLNPDLSIAKAHFWHIYQATAKGKVKVKVEVGLLYLQEQPHRTVEYWIQHVLHGFMSNLQFWVLFLGSKWMYIKAGRIPRRWQKINHGFFW